MAKYKDYPLYTYDEPATYSDFSGGINTDPSNEHLQPNEMRDCLNMTYKSAALVKRPGASLLCNISCDDELFNIQGVFLFTYRITYLIIAADGKLYSGFYSPNSTIYLTRLPIKFNHKESLEKFNPYDLTAGLNEYVSEQLNTQHDGFIYSYGISKEGIKEDLSLLYRGDFKDISGAISNGQIVSYNGTKYKLNIKDSHTEIQKTVIYPINTEYWIELSEYNTRYSDRIESLSDPISSVYNGVSERIPLVLDNSLHQWKFSGDSIATETETWATDNSYPSTWTEKYNTWNLFDVIKYNDDVYICIKAHINYTGAPPSSGGYYEWEQVYEQKELIFQNHNKIESATYNNKLYITTGTRFIVVELIDNKLNASIVQPYACNTTEIINIGYNFLSPYPELCRKTIYNQAITSIDGLLAIKNMYGTFTLTPQMTFAQGETEKDYCFKWEKKINNKWLVLHSYKDNFYKTSNYTYIEDINGDYIFDDETNMFYLYTDETDITRYTKVLSGTTKQKYDYSKIEVTDADKYQYRVTFAKDFEQDSSIYPQWNFNIDKYKIDDKIEVKDSSNVYLSKVYKCIKEHSPKKILWDNIEYQEDTYSEDTTLEGLYKCPYSKDSYGNYITKNNTIPTFSSSTTTRSGIPLYKKDGDHFIFVAYDTNAIIQGDTYWELVSSEENINLLDGTTSSDWIVDKIAGTYTGQATSILSEDIKIEDTFNIIQSCKKIVSDSNKFLLYDDKYNSGSWYKTIIDNPSYITQRGSLSFKTNKNEALIKVIPFNGNLIAFANAENIGGSIHIVTGSGDDYSADQYYSPYRRAIINNTVSCDNPDTVQVCENILVFKYFDTVYYISGSELSNEVVSVYSCNDRIKLESKEVKIPWDDNSCISEVTEDYYALIWKEKHYIENDTLILDRPAIKVKMYYKTYNQIEHIVYYPWLRDESEYFNIDHIIYIKGKPVYLYNNTLINFNTNVYKDFDKTYECMIHFRGEDLNYPKILKLISNILVYYHRDQSSEIDFNLLTQNEAGHILLDNTIKRVSLQDLRALKTDMKILDGATRLDSTILDSRVFNTAYKFPCLLADTKIYASNDKEFSVSSITYNYITIEPPDTTTYDLYSNIIRPKEV